MQSNVGILEGELKQRHHTQLQRVILFTQHGASDTPYRHTEYRKLAGAGSPLAVGGWETLRQTKTNTDISADDSSRPPMIANKSGGPLDSQLVTGWPAP